MTLLCAAAYNLTQIVFPNIRPLPWPNRWHLAFPKSRENAGCVYPNLLTHVWVLEGYHPCCLHNTHTHTHIYIHTHTHAHTYAHMHTRTHTHTHTCTHTRTHAHTHIHTHTHTHIHSWLGWSSYRDHYQRDFPSLYLTEYLVDSGGKGGGKWFSSINTIPPRELQRRCVQPHPLLSFHSSSYHGMASEASVMWKGINTTILFRLAAIRMSQLPSLVR